MCSQRSSSSAVRAGLAGNGLPIFFLLTSLSLSTVGAEPDLGAARIGGRVAYDVPHTCLSPLIAWDELKGATLRSASNGVYQIVMDGKGADLALVMNTQTVEVYGTVEQKGGEKWLTVLDYADPGLRAAHELWRRYCCNDCTIHSALINASIPRDARGARPIAGREYPLREEFTAWTRDAENLWVAADGEIMQIDFKRRAVVRSHGRGEGLPDAPVYQLFSQAGTLWIVHRGGVAALAAGAPRIEDLPAFRLRFARVCGDGTNVWIIADVGTFKMHGAQRAPQAYPAIPTARRIAERVDAGLRQAQWARQSRHFVSEAVAVGERLYAGSFGEVYELAGGEWNRIARDGWALHSAAGRVWFIGVKGVTEYDPANRSTKEHTPPRIRDGRYSQFVMTSRAAWVAAEPSSADDRADAGGLARLDLATGQWAAWQEIAGERVNHVCALAEADGAVWAVNAGGRYVTQVADPGMMHVKRRMFETSGFCMLRFDEGAKKWEDIPLDAPALEQRLVCGHDGSAERKPIVPQSVREISVGAGRIFGSARLVPTGYFGGYWPCVEQIASRSGNGEGWVGRFGHHPEELDLQGEQPKVLNISNSGRAFRPAVGHDEVLGLFAHEGTHWAVTEGCVAYFDEAAKTWRKLAETRYRFYWRATAALDAGDCLYVGSDRGLISRLDFATGRFEIMAGLKDRSVSRIVRGESGKILAASVPAPLGQFPARLEGVPLLDCAAAELDGESWRAVPEEQVPGAAKPRWAVKAMGKRSVRDKSRGNVLWGPSPDDSTLKPRFYLKEVFFPLFLCESEDGARLWLSTFNGIVRVDNGGA